PHHGSRGSASPALLAAVRPRLALISCGQGNSYGHPHAEALDRIARTGAALLRTDRDGTITVTISPGGYRIRWTRGFPGPRALLPGFPLSAPTAIS
ncbi:MBL fold metallo-hydrolase, partial [bacterium]|nr:MBL fold metallo-hydrolase [bacterium]